jgi:hypothetical protein
MNFILFGNDLVISSICMNISTYVFVSLYTSMAHISISLKWLNPEVTVTQFALQNTGCPQLITTKIKLVRAEELMV